MRDGLIKAAQVEQQMFNFSNIVIRYFSKINPSFKNPTDYIRVCCKDSSQDRTIRFSTDGSFSKCFFSSPRYYFLRDIIFLPFFETKLCSRIDFIGDGDLGTLFSQALAISR